MKQKSQFVCKECGAIYPKWLGKCTTCRKWETIIEHIEETDRRGKPLKLTKKDYEIKKLSEIEYNDEIRLITGINEFDRVLGGGFVPGSIVLLGGDPGIGKSTLLLQTSSNLTNFKPIYITGEESLIQIKSRAERITDIDLSLEIVAETKLENIIDIIKSKNYNFVVIDSIQAIHSVNIESTPGSFLQVRECTALLAEISKSTNIPILIIGHINKEGSIAGPKILEHIVDTVLQFEGEKGSNFRILRALKNRYGSTNEIGIFEMSESGLVEISNPSNLFLGNQISDEIGISISSTIEGSRPILLEIQALATTTSFSMPQRNITGFDQKRLLLLLAILEKKLNTPFFRHDVYVNIAGGAYFNDPALDLGIITSLMSSMMDIPVKKSTIIIGEVGLTGEIRSVSHIEQRLNEAAKLGFENTIIPLSNYKTLNSTPNLKIHAFDKIRDAISFVLED